MTSCFQKNSVTEKGTSLNKSIINSKGSKRQASNKVRPHVYRVIAMILQYFLLLYKQLNEPGLFFFKCSMCGNGNAPSFNFVVVICRCRSGGFAPWVPSTPIKQWETF